MLKVRTCKTCPLYSRELSRCRMGFVNPPTKRATAETVAAFGSDYVCHYNRWKNGNSSLYLPAGVMSQ
ncbi:hypothetical protein [Syntrophothermus lipocalidus]|uniref:Uncharacterized protein n=1 Tax=Syntrophothermus lipocalidus (strain DSM 12680 / TGB-C1) TaxID=643648 RepID=D7CPR3_SYNLT|nr:hypothetical protein [Syntrophothermus lipocalidus]ADI02691.1 hypothetical protein Slip_1939 [Syntrophothermus lipocalidus DSM 12680]